MAVLLAGCGTAPYPDYWEDAGTGPTVNGVTPNRVDDVFGGQQIVISGTDLDTARTVVIGSRNAAIVEATATQVTVEVPPFVPGGGTVDVAVVTDDGAARLEEAFTYAFPDAEWLADEVASVTLARLECPVEISGFDPAEVRLFWCGLEMGEAWASGWIGDGPQSGMAGDLSGQVPVSTLPPPGQVRVLGPADLPPLERPQAYGARSGDESIAITTEQRFGRHLDFLEERMALAESTYSYWSYVTEVTGPIAAQFDADACWLGDAEVVSGEGESLVLATDGDPEADGIWLGFTVLEDFGDGETYLTEAYTGTALITTLDGTEITSARTGAVLAYDDYSGGFEGTGVGGTIGLSDLLPEVEYTVSTSRLGETTERGRALGMIPLVVLAPDLFSGDVPIDTTEDFTLQWTPPPADEIDPSYLGIEIRVYDGSIDDPNWLTEVARLVARADDLTGTFTLPASELSKLPLAPNALDVDWEFTGYWAEMTVARHTLRKVDMETPYGGDLVIDFVHAVNGSVRLTGAR